jgi:hypothetical protein
VVGECVVSVTASGKPLGASKWIEKSYGRTGGGIVPESWSPHDVPRLWRLQALALADSGGDARRAAVSRLAEGDATTASDEPTTQREKGMTTALVIRCWYCRELIDLTEQEADGRLTGNAFVVLLNNKPAHLQCCPKGIEQEELRRERSQRTFNAG